jgi:oxygen-independent coproporphyrinogen-3 oxidase
MGIGPSAWSHIGGERFKNAASLDEYCLLTRSGDPATFREHLRGEQSARQAAILALRTSRGIDWKKFGAKYGELAAQTIKTELERFPGDLVENEKSASRLTPKGFRLGNAIWSEIVG